MNGNTVMTVPHIVAEAYKGASPTSYIQVWDLQQILDSVGLDASGYNGAKGIWNVVSPGK